MKTIYKIIDLQTSKQVGKDYDSRAKASHRAEKLDLQYGAIRYIVKWVDVEE